VGGEKVEVGWDGREESEAEAQRRDRRWERRSGWRQSTSERRCLRRRRMPSCSCSAREAARPVESAAEENSDGENDGERKAQRTGSEAKASSGEAGSSDEAAVGEVGDGTDAVRRSLEVGERKERGVVGAAMGRPERWIWDGEGDLAGSGDSLTDVVVTSFLFLRWSVC
jgi:hypothetical protein